MDLWIGVAATVFTVLSRTDASLSWKTATNPLIIGEEAILSCNGNNCLPEYSKKWFGGKNFDLLCVNDFSYNPSKYNMKTHGSSFDLTIKNVTLTDLYSKYTCTCGFLKYTDLLKGNQDKIIYPPRVLQNSLTQKNRILHLDILLEVYPFPNCTLLFEDTVLSDNFSVQTLPKEMEFQFYEVAYNHSVVVPGGSICDGNITLTCKVGSITYLVCRHIIPTCKDKDKPAEVANIIIGLAGGIFLFILVMLVSILFCFKCRSGQIRGTDGRAENGENSSSEMLATYR